MASRRRDAIVGIVSVYQQKCMIRFDGKYVRIYLGTRTPRLRHFPTYVVTEKSHYVSYGTIIGLNPVPYSPGMWLLLSRQ